MTGADLKFTREQMGLSQSQLAEALGIERGKSTISEWERGLHEMPPYLSLALLWLGRIAPARK